MAQKKRLFKNIKKKVGNKSGNVREKELHQTAQPIKMVPKHLFPKNVGTITENVQKQLISKGWLFWLASAGGVTIVVISFVLFVFCVREALFAASILSERSMLNREMLLWENIASKYPNYRDADFQVAILAYRLSDRQKSQEYIAKTLELDPNFEPARRLSTME